ncbi:MAG: response regulator [Treponema sp.]|jgi:signal transduction histidine kinase/ActR/RegA family two-component response regulator|nr:response regulator [Treponema sp.]
MSIRIKVFLIITVIILAITASSVVISISSAQNEIIKTLENSMQSVASVANEYISSELDLLMIDASAVVQALQGIPIEDLRMVLIEQVAAYSDSFLAVTVFNSLGGVEAAYGSIPTPDDMILGEYGQQALRGQKIISTTRQSPSGAPVFHIFVPMADAFFQGDRQDSSRSRIAAFTVPGMYFSKKVNQFQLWGTGNIAMGDREGTILANVNHDWVTRRVNFLDLIKKDSRHKAVTETIRRMIAGESGASRFVFDGVDAVTAFVPITTSDQGWFVTVTAPIAESPFHQVRNLIIISGFIFLGLGMLAAAIASGSIAKPFYQVREQNAQLIKMGEALKAAEAAKTNFIANMSFDMRAPLSAVIGLSELSLTKKDVSSDVKGYLERIYKSGVSLMGVIGELLDISNMDSGKFGVMPAEYDLCGFINETASANMRSIGSKSVAFRIVPDEKLPARLIGDTLRIKQIYNNLISNAIKYTKEGTVEWRVSTERDGDSVWLVSSFTDTGVGIRPEDIDKLFIDYNSTDAARVRSRNHEEVSGLGLTLTKKIAALMDGTITVESVLGKGSTFTVRIRQKYLNDDVISADGLAGLKNFKYIEKHVDKASLQRVQLPKIKVLVVDDIELNLEIAQGMLKPYGMSVDCLANGQEAVNVIRRGEPRYDAILMSRWMSEMDGKEAVRMIRKEIDSDYARNIPIIALTSTTVIGNKDIFLSLGFQDVLSKPLDVLHLDEVINTWIAPQSRA